MIKSIVLARPHPFIVAEMTPFLEQAGYRIVKPEGRKRLPSLARSSAGAVVSLAVSSTVAESAADIYQQLFAAAPLLPVLFAGISSLYQMRVSLYRIAKQAGVQASVVGVSAANEKIGSLNDARTFLNVGKDDLTDPARRQIAARMVLRHLL